MTADSCVKGIEPQHTDATLDAVTSDRCYHAAPLVLAEPSHPDIHDITDVIQLDKCAISEIGNLEALPELSNGEAQPPREVRRTQRRRLPASTDTFPTSQPSAESDLETSVILAKRMAEIALQRPSHGGTAAPNPPASCTPNPDTANGGPSLIDEGPQMRHVRPKAQVSQPTSLHLPSSNLPNGAVSTAAGAFSNTVLDLAPDTLVATASAAALAAAEGSLRLASIAVARQPPPPGEVKIYPSRPYKRVMTAPRSGDTAHYSLTVYTSSSKQPSPASVQMSDGSITAPAPAWTPSLSSTAPLNMNGSSSSSSSTSWRGSQSTSAAPRARGYKSPGASATRRRGGTGRSHSSAFANDTTAFVVANGMGINLPGHSDGGGGSDGGSKAASQSPPATNDILVNHGKLLVDRELLAVEVRRLASQVQHLTVQQGMLQEELQRLLSQNSNLNSALASTVTTCESQAELMDILSEAMRSTVLVDEHDVSAEGAGREAAVVVGDSDDAQGVPPRASDVASSREPEGGGNDHRKA